LFLEGRGVGPRKTEEKGKLKGRSQTFQGGETKALAPVDHLFINTQKGPKTKNKTRRGESREKPELRDYRKLKIIFANGGGFKFV